MVDNLPTLRDEECAAADQQRASTRSFEGREGETEKWGKVIRAANIKPD